MMQTLDMQTRIDQLTAILATPLAPDARRIVAERLLASLRRPVRVTVVGRPGSGISTLLLLLTLDPTLAGISIAQATMMGDPAQDAAQLATILPQADIVLWCGQGLEAADRILWGRVSDAVKDHSFLVLTKADLLAANGLLQPAMTALQDLVTDDFQAMLPVATLQAISALAQGDTAALRASGAAALRTAILRDATAGRRAVQDSVDLFLRRHAVPPPPPSSAAPVHPAPRMWTRVNLLLEQKAQQLRLLALPDGADKVGTILDHCCQTADALAMLMSGDPTAVTDPLSEDIMTLADTVLLMRIENTPAAAVDALDLLLQIRRAVAGQLTS